MKLETFFEKFELFADAPKAVAKMRELVLELAVQGKLVSQDPNDEPATKLLERVRGARQRLADKGSLKTKVHIPEVEADDQLYAIPKTWLWVPLNELTELVYGKMLPTSDLLPTGFPVFGANGIIGFFSKYLYEDEMLLISCRGAYSGTPNISPPKCYVTNNSIVCEFFEPKACDIRFYHAVISVSPRERIVTGSAQPQVTVANAIKLPIPLPPLAEQKRIVAKVDELMALCDRLEAQQQEREEKHKALSRASLARFGDAPTPGNLNFLFHSSFNIQPSDIRKSILTLAVQGKLVPQDPEDEPAEELIARLVRELTPEQSRRQAAPLPLPPAESFQYEVPESWTWARFRSVAIIASNLVKPDEFLDFTHLAPDNIEKGNGVLLPCRTVREDKVISSNHRFYPGQIVYSKIRPNLAKVVVVDFEGLCSADMYPIDALIDTFYLQRYMLSESFLVQAVKTDTRVAMPKINQMELNAISVPLPPLAEQRRIVAKVEELMKLVDALETQLAASRTTAANLLAALVAELTGTPNNGKVSLSSSSGTGRRGRPPKSS